MKESEKNLNSGHRKRMRESFLKRDIDSLNEHEILEILLFYAYSRRDTNKIAHRLINYFGSLQNVFNAPFEELIKVDDVGENAASLIILFNRLSHKYKKDIYNKGEAFSEEKIIEFLNNKYKYEKEEVVTAIFFDDRGRYITTSEVSRGTSMETSFETKNLVALAMRYSAEGIVLAHNHPRGLPLMSAADVKATRDIQRILEVIGIRLIDHLIISDQDYYSMKQSGKLSDVFIGF